ncbi:hypothetical protein HYY75_12275, partial [bacterium]|nr:hypothetical protein [bacterium]
MKKNSFEKKILKFKANGYAFFLNFSLSLLIVTFGFFAIPIFAQTGNSIQINRQLVSDLSGSSPDGLIGLRSEGSMAFIFFRDGKMKEINLESGTEELKTILPVQTSSPETLK